MNYERLQDRLSNLWVKYIEGDILETFDFGEIIKDWAQKEHQKKSLSLTQVQFSKRLSWSKKRIASGDFEPLKAKTVSSDKKLWGHMFEIAND